MRIEINLDEGTAQAIEARATASGRSRKNYIENLCKIAATYPIQAEDPPALKKPTMPPVVQQEAKEKKKISPPIITYLEPIPIALSFYPGAIVPPDQYSKKTNPAGYIFTTQDGRSFFVSIPIFYFEGFNYEFTQDSGSFEDSCNF